jgi:hypothetical protein
VLPSTVLPSTVLPSTVTDAPQQAPARRPDVARPDASRPQQTPQAHVAPAPGDRTSLRPAVSAAGRAAAIRRARVLAVLLLFTACTWVGVAVSLLDSVVALASTALLLADLAALRAVARRRQLERGRAPIGRSRSGIVAPGSASSAPATTLTADGAPAAATEPAVDAHRAARSTGAPLRRTLPPAASRRPAAHRVSRREAPAAEAGLPTADGTWMPVPVPPPTYTLKPMAPRPEPPVLDLDDHRPGGPAGPGAASGAGAGEGSGRSLVVGSERLAAPGGPVPDRYEAVEPPAAESRPARRPWDDDREWADDLDLDAVLARRRAVNG